MSDAKVHIDAGNELHGAVVETNSYIVNISRQYARIYSYDDYRTGVLAPTAQPTSLTFSNVTTTTMDVSFTASVGGADGYVAFRRTGASPTFVPVDGTTYTVGNTYGDSTCQHFGAGVTFSETGLSAYTTYHYDIFAWNGAVGTYAFLTTSPLEGSQLTAYSFGNCLRLDGTNDYTKGTATNLFSGASTASIMFWAKSDTTINSNRYLISKLSNSQVNGFAVTTENSNVMRIYVCNAGNTNGRFTIGAGVTNWNFYEIYFNGSGSTNADRLIVKINNVQQSLTFTGTIPATIASLSKLVSFGAWLQDNLTAIAFHWDGLIDDIVFYSDANQQNGIDMYNSGLGTAPPATNRLSWYKLNESNSTTTTVDEDGRDNHSLVNFNFDASSGWETR